MSEINNPAQLSFDPEIDIKTEEIRNIFDSKMARTLWLAIKPKHLTDQYFNKNCLGAGRTLETLEIKSESHLKNILWSHFKYDFGGNFISELFPYVMEDKSL